MIEIRDVSRNTAKLACQRYHYSHKLPAVNIAIHGVFEDEKFLGVIIYSSTPPTIYCNRKVVELSRIALKRHDFFLSQVLSKSIKKISDDNPELVAIISYSDFTGQNHKGIIYQATNWLYVGTSRIKEFNMKVGTKEHHSRIFGKSSNLKVNDFKDYIRYKDTLKNLYVMPLNRKARKLVKKYSYDYWNGEGEAPKVKIKMKMFNEID